MKPTIASLSKMTLRVGVLGFALAFFLYTGSKHQTNSLNLTNVKDVLSTSRLSFVARENGSNVVGSDLVNLDTTQGAWESTSSANLFINDPVTIGTGGSMNNYTVSGIPTSSQIQLLTALSSSNNAASGAYVIASRSASHTVTFTTVSAINNGAFRVLIPSVATSFQGATGRDGIPDAGGFDFGTGTPNVTCPTNTAQYAFTTGTASNSAVQVGSTWYHSFECRYAGTGLVGATLTMTIGSTTAIINPAPTLNHTAGTADQYKFIVQQTDNYTNAAAIIDQTVGGLAVVESVRVTATVDPQITFAILGVPGSTSACGLTTSIATTPTAVAYGSIPINAFTVAAHTITVSTNATAGYAVTTIENDQLGRAGNVCTGTGPTFTNPCIADSPRDTGSRSTTVGSAWATATANYGFAYTLGNNQNGATITAAGTNPNYLDFPDFQVNEVPQTVMSGTSVASNQNAMVCYKISVGPTQQAGDYTNNITYTATATF